MKHIFSLLIVAFVRSSTVDPSGAEREIAESLLQLSRPQITEDEAPKKKFRLTVTFVTILWEFNIEDAIQEYRRRVEYADEKCDTTFNGRQIILTGDPLEPCRYYELGFPVLSTPERASFLTPSDPSGTLEYTIDQSPAHADDPSGIHKGLRSYWFMKRASEFRLSAAPIGIAPPIPLRSIQDPRMRFSISQEVCEALVAQDAAQVTLVAKRYEFLTLSMSKDIRLFGLVDALRFGASLITKLRKLHQEARIVHGGLSPESIIFEGDNFRFRDFDRSEFLDLSNNEISVPRRSAPLFSLIDRFGSDRNLSPRAEDVFRAIAIVSWLTYTDDSPVPGVEASAAKWSVWKREHQHELRAIGVNHDLLRKLQASWRRIVKMTMDTTAVDPRYSEIVSAMNEMIRTFAN